MDNRDIQKILNENESVFSLIIAVAKRSRDISENAQNNHTELSKKPVNIAMEEMSNGKIRVVK